MANPEHLAILKQGVAAWNAWREQNPDVGPDLDGADLQGEQLPGASLGWADLHGANLRRTDLSGADLTGADLSEAYLFEVRLEQAMLFGADLCRTSLLGADLRNSFLGGANFNSSSMGLTVLGGVDLSEVVGLETVQHLAPSMIAIDTIYKSGGNIPEAFLRGAGVPESFITYMRSLVVQPIELYSCFISHSSRDRDFAQRLYVDLQSRGVRCWFAPEDMKIGDRIQDRIDQAIRVYDKLLLVLSRQSIGSNWVEREVQQAFRKEGESPDRAAKPLVLFPIRLDNTIEQARSQWARRIYETRHVGDFSRWKDHDQYQAALARLLRDLQAGGSAPDG